jgi:hypothetical protein
MFLPSIPVFARSLPLLARRVTSSSMAPFPGNCWTRVEPGNGTPPFSVYNKPVIKPDNDERDYRVIQLQNGLQAVLIHDAETDKAAASMDVAVGHLSDPDDMPGLAHFCEHLLFMVSPAGL